MAGAIQDETLPLLADQSQRRTSSSVKTPDASPSSTSDIIQKQIDEKLADDEAGFQRSKRLWGRSPILLLTPEETAGPRSRFLYSWVSHAVDQVTHEGLSSQTLPSNNRCNSAWVLGQKLKLHIRRQLLSRFRWEPMIGASLRKMDSPSSRGVLRWVGYLPRSSHPHRLMAGVEWRTPPREYLVASKKNLNQPKLHSGTVDGERLFDVVGETASCEPVTSLWFLKHWRYLEETGGVILPKEPKLEAIAKKFFSLPYHPQSLSLPSAFRDAFFTGVLAAAIPITLSDLCRMMGPLGLYLFVKFLEHDHPQWWHGIGIVLLLSISIVVHGVMFQKGKHLASELGLQCRGALMSIIYEKSLHLPPKAKVDSKFSSKAIQSLLDKDAQRAYDFAWCLFACWSGTLQILLSLGFLVFLVGWSASFGVLVLLLCIPTQVILQRKIQSIKKHLLLATESRIKHTAEALTEMKVIKYVSLEEKFFRDVTKDRENELRLLHWQQVYRVVSTVLLATTPMFAIAAILISYTTVLGESLTPDVVFPVMVLVILLRNPLFFLPSIISMLLAFRNSMKRVEEFLEYGMSKAETGNRNSLASDDVAAVFEAVTASNYSAESIDLPKNRCEGEATAWEKRWSALCNCCCSRTIVAPIPPSSHEETVPSGFFNFCLHPVLSNVSFVIPRNSFTVIFCEVPRGAAAVIEALLKELVVLEGQVHTTKSIAYVPHHPWIASASIRSNIVLFGDVDQSRLDRVVQCCQLAKEMKSFPEGLETEVGERGLTLSQKQAALIGIARAIYSDQQMILFDEPFTCFSSTTFEFLVRQCLVEELAGRTRVLATSNRRALPLADNIVVLDTACVSFIGTYEQYQQRFDLSDSSASSPALFASPTAMGPSSPKYTVAASSPRHDRSDTDSSVMAIRTRSGFEVKGPENEDDKETAVVSWNTYFFYLTCCGGHFLIGVVVVLSIITELSFIGGNLWLALWSRDTGDVKPSTYLYVYLMFVASSALTGALRAHFTFGLMRVASASIHKTLLKSVLAAKISFFDKAITAKILRRFTTDIQQCDGDLQNSIMGGLNSMFSLLGALIVIIVSQPLSLIALIPAGFFYIRLLGIYNSANRQINKVTSQVRPPVSTWLAESVEGRSLVTAWGKEGIFLREFLYRLDQLFAATYFQTVCNRWVGVRLNLLGAVVITSVAAAGTLTKYAGYETSNLGLQCLGLTIGLALPILTSEASSKLASIEAAMSNVEKIISFTNSVEVEDDWKYSEKQERPTFALHDTSISFSGVSLKYPGETTLALNQVSFRLNTREKVGIVGKSGSGKSSLFRCLLRAFDILSGEIRIRGVPISAFTLRDLRSQFTVVPSDPVLFEGTLRTNLDPFGEFSNIAVSDALTKVGMRQRVLGLGPMGVDTLIEDRRHSLFSAGERQLLYLARAILKNKMGFVLIDEAVGDSDAACDEAIQRTIRTAFAGYTVLTIARRLNTIFEYDRVMVMSGGLVAELGPPNELARQPKSLFRHLIGPVALEHLQAASQGKSK